MLAPTIGYVFESTRYTGNILYWCMNKELIRKQLTFIGIVLGTFLLLEFNAFLIKDVADWLEEDYIPLGLTILQVWLVTKTYK